MAKVWFITGSSRGLGRSLTEAVLAHGDVVAATARNPAALQELINVYPDQLLTLALDVSNPAQILSTVEQAWQHFGRIDVLVNNAGFGITGAAEAFTDEQVQQQLAVNLYAPIALTRAVLPIMRGQRSGRILQISSIGGRVGGAGLTIYQAAKFGLGGFSEALGKEVAPLGIKVTSIEPGGFRTDWAGSSMTVAPTIEGYDGTVEAVKSFLLSGSFVPMGDPHKAAKAIITVAETDEPPVHLVLGSEAVGILQRADTARAAELEQWMYLSRSTDHDDAVNMLESEAGKKYLSQKGIKM
jgi:NAD(P)-dependent dehydrogenase (short-subunit alcohol dehydrogenase family)